MGTCFTNYFICEQFGPQVVFGKILFVFASSTLGDERNSSRLSCMNVHVTIFSRIAQQIKFLNKAPLYLTTMSSLPASTPFHFILFPSRAVIIPLKCMAHHVHIFGQRVNSSHVTGNNIRVFFASV